MLTGIVSLVIFVQFLPTWYECQRGEYNRFVGLVQWAFEGMLGQIDSVIPDKKIARQIAPLALTIFFYVLITYWMSILPGLDTITYHGVPVFELMAADLNFTFALAIISLVLTQNSCHSPHGQLGNIEALLP